ncbi:hypothetical protein [Bradyrhizobium yuanmingense]|nr:hypothetical protein [Bradyrhizobium yuanmingense]
MSEDNAIDLASTKSPTADFLEGLYGEPLRAETMRTGRHLIIASTICAVVVTFDVQLKGTGLVPLDFGNRPEVLAMLMALAVILLLLSFVLRTWTDLLRERETAKLVTQYIEDERVDAARESAEGADAEELRSRREALDEPEYYDQEDSNWDAYHKVKDAADAALQKAEDRLRKRRWPLGLRRTWMILEAGLPIVFAAFAIYKSWTSVNALFKALFLS